MPDVSYGTVPRQSGNEPLTENKCTDAVCINASRIYDSCGSPAVFLQDASLHRWRLKFRSCFRLPDSKYDQRHTHLAVNLLSITHHL